MNMKNVLLVFLIANALFWGLFPHTAHCNLVKSVSDMINVSIKCPSHNIHLLSGLAFYLVAMYVAQKK